MPTSQPSMVEFKAFSRPWSWRIFGGAAAEAAVSDVHGHEAADFDAGAGTLEAQRIDVREVERVLVLLQPHAGADDIDSAHAKPAPWRKTEAPGCWLPEP
jgi:hypothetical protein